MNFSIAYAFIPRKPNHCMLLFFGACGKSGTHAEGTNEGQPNGASQVSHNNSFKECAVKVTPIMEATHSSLSI
jgi:hypothetical protein